MIPPSMKTSISAHHYEKLYRDVHTLVNFKNKQPTTKNPFTDAYFA